MSRTTSLTTRVIAGDNDSAVYGAGLAIYGAPTTNDSGDSTVLVPLGKFVFYNPLTGLSTGTAATKSTVELLKVGVAIDPAGTGVATDIRWLNDGMTGCSALDQSGRAANCGLGSITDVFIRDCIECGKTYTIEIRAFDPISDAFNSYGKGAVYTFSYTPPCSDCTGDNCNETAPTAHEVVCGLYNVIHGIKTNPLEWDVKLNNFPLPRNHKYPFEVSKLFSGAGTTKQFCLTETDATCLNCNLLTPIGGYDLATGGDPDVVFDPATFTGVNSTRGQIDNAINQLNAALDGSGRAVLLMASGNCCADNKIEVNTCLTTFTLNNHLGDPITPCSESNPFADIVVPAICDDCDSEDTTITFTDGLRFYSKAVERECDCIPGNNALVEYFSELEVYPKYGFSENGGAYVKKRQTATLPEGQGFQWQAREIQTLTRPNTPFYTEGNWHGLYGTPAKNDLLNQATVNCRDSYCVIAATVGTRTDHQPMGDFQTVNQTVYILIPTGNTTASASFLTAWNNYFSGGDCGRASISCA